jgi:hypothetical protein
MLKEPAFRAGVTLPANGVSDNSFTNPLLSPHKTAVPLMLKSELL